MTVLLVLGVGVAGAPPASAADPCLALPKIDDHCERWISTEQDGVFVRTAASPDGSKVFGTGAILDGAGYEDFFTAAYDATTGQRLWEATYGGDDAEQAQAIAVSPDGAHVYVTGWGHFGTGTPLGGYSAIVVSYDAVTGAERWATEYTPPDHRDENPWGVTVGPAVDAAGKTIDSEAVYVSGAEQIAAFSDGDSRDSNFVTLAFDGADGSLDWRSAYDGPAHEWDYGYDIARSPDGRSVYMIGTSETSVPDPNDYAGDLTVVAFDATSGARRWVGRYVGPEHRAGMAFGIAVSPDAREVAVTGLSEQARGAPYVYVTAAFDATTGDALWSMRHAGATGPDQIPTAYNNPGLNLTVHIKGFGDQANDIAFAPDGSTVYMTGSMRNFPNGTDYGTIAYDAHTGSEKWVATYNGPTSRFDFANAIAVSPDGSRIYVTGDSSWSGIFQLDSGGESFGWVGDDVATVAYDTAGNQLWVARYNGPGQHEDGGIDVVATQTGVFVAGIVADGSDPFITEHDDTAMLSYDA